MEFKKLFGIGIFLLVLLLFVGNISAQDDTSQKGCCLVTTTGGFCSTLNVNLRDTYCEDRDLWVRGAFREGETGESVCQEGVSSSSDDYGTVNNACSIGCSVINGVGTYGRTKIAHIKDVVDRNIDSSLEQFYQGLCRPEHSRDTPVACSLDPPLRLTCTWGLTREECRLSDGQLLLTIDTDQNGLDENDCNRYTIENQNANWGCCVDDCTAGFGQGCSDFRWQQFCAQTECSETRGCSFRFSCAGNTVIQEDTCGGQALSVSCGVNEYCCADDPANCPASGCTTASCFDDNGNFVAIGGASWCDSGGAEPGDVHVKATCINGKIEKERCGEFRSEICVEDEDLFTAGCVPNRWEECLAENNPARCERDELIDSCEFKFGECLPRYPLGFRFWDCEKNPTSDDCKTYLQDVFTLNSPTSLGSFNSLMCNVESSSGGCLASGDCYASNIPEFEEFTPPPDVVELFGADWGLGNKRFGAGPSTTGDNVNIFFWVTSDGEVDVKLKKTSVNIDIIKNYEFKEGKFRIVFNFLDHDLATGIYFVEYYLDGDRKGRQQINFRK